MDKLTLSTTYFAKPGSENTAETLKLAAERAAALNIKTILIATTTGDTAIKAAEIFNSHKIVAVTHSTGFKQPNTQEMTHENINRFEALGGTVLTCQHAFGGVNRAIRKKLNTFEIDEIIAYTLRIFGQGMKVIPEITMMAADAGLVRTDEPIMGIAGTGRGADTAAIIVPVNAQDFFNMRILEIVCIPAQDHPGFF
jgi:hypothetical protein